MFMLLRCLVARSLILVALVSPIAASAESIIYPRPESDGDSRSIYQLRVLQLALSKAGVHSIIAPSPLVMDQGRALKQLELTGGGIDVVWSMTTEERERHLRPIRIPIDKGLLGWRLALVSRDSAQRFSTVANLSDLRGFVACQGHDWPDTLILSNNGIKVIVDTGYAALFRLVEKGSADYFPRSIIEIWDELDAHRKEGLVLDPFIAIHYPAAEYFFVSRSNSKLADDITRGLEAAIADGSFERMFQAEFADKLQRANLSKRVAITLSNPLLPRLTPLDRKDLWLDPRTPH